MQKIIVSAIIATMVTVGTYLVAVVFGASEAAAIAALVAAIVAVVVAFATTVFDTFATAASVVVVAAVAVVAAAAAFAVVGATSVFVATVAAAFALAAAFAVAAEYEGVKFRWAFAAYALEAASIGGALMIGSVGWSVAIALTGVVALLVLWRFAPKPIATHDAPSTSTVQESNGA